MMRNIPDRPNVIGIDIGSVSLSVVQMDLDGKVLNTAYTFHKGDIRKSLVEIQKNLDLTNVCGLAGVSSSAALNTGVIHQYHTQMAIIAAARFLQPQAGSVLHIGAERFMFIQFDSEGNYQFTRTNSSCAAGTGSFLDQQADRLNLSGAGELCQMALANKESTPNIASRCAVFAKTDLIHAQQRGYSLEAISDSLCKGLATNIANTTFNKMAVNYPILMTGGVSKNTAVVRHLEALAGTTFLHDDVGHLFGAIGAARLLLKDRTKETPLSMPSLEDILKRETTGNAYYYGPLNLTQSHYPDFASVRSFLFEPLQSLHPRKVEIDFYQRPDTGIVYPVYLGIDIGSTSTKAVLLDSTKEPFVGLYTYTAGNPLSAVKALFESIDHINQTEGITISILGAGTTGSGRNFVGKIIGADLVLDEITTHARAAYELNPDTDTIIEIGGQDSKFTMMDHGRVTFSQMNTVCAAGTGSFIEEQAMKLNCPLKDYDMLAANVSAPIASDRCTVFMERDINHLLSQGYTVNEVLATVLHSVAENYLKRVANEASIGKYVCFQGATARNKSLVAAFEQRLNRPIFVSRYCHLAGALGTALLLQEEGGKASQFRGLALFREMIPVQTEACALCANNCNISVAHVRGEKVAYGFMCGRDYETQKKVSKNKSGFDLIRERRKIFAVAKKSNRPKPIVGIPASLHLFEELPLWKQFFNHLGIRTISSEKYRESLKQGKLVAGAEFCAPIDALYGDVTYLAGKADYIFLPVFLQSRDKPKDAERNYCYYTQFSPSLIYNMGNTGIKDKCLSPLLNFTKGNMFVSLELFKSLKAVVPDISLASVYTALTKATSGDEDQRRKLKKLFEVHFREQDGVSVVLLGRPYVVLSPELNKGIPDIFNGLGVKTFYQDMLPTDQAAPVELDALLKKVPWYYASRILETAQRIARTPNLYPVLISAFKCAPDSFIVEYFKKTLAQSGKPYLILQIDEHDSNVGYETRIEAAVRSFKNHAALQGPQPRAQDRKILPDIDTSIGNKTLLMPGWDPIVTPLLAANLKRIGIDARVMKSSSFIIRKSMAHNTGQCLPVNIVAQEFVDYIHEHHLDPANTMLFMLDSKLTCNIRLYPQYIKSMLENIGNGLEKAHVYCGAISHLEISLSACYYAYFAYMIGGLIRRLGCKIRPYEMNKGQTNRAIAESVTLLEGAFLGIKNMEEALSEAAALFDEIPVAPGNRPKVALFGDFYVCDNDVMNQSLIQAIEDAGGEVITIPYSDYVRINRDNVVRRYMERGEYYKAVQLRLILASLKWIDQRYYRPFMKHLGSPYEIDSKKFEQHLKKFNINPYLGGESYDNILKIFYIMERYPDTALFVQTNPSFCCPSLVTEAMTNQIKRVTGIPVVTITYDGTEDYKNDIIIPYLQEKSLALRTEKVSQ